MSDRELPFEIAHYARQWLRDSIRWNVGFFVLGTLGIGLPAMLASGIIENALATKCVAIAATVVSGLQTFLKGDLRAYRLHAAFRHLNTAKMRFEHDVQYPISAVIDAYEKAEQIIEAAFAPTDTENSN